MVYLLKFWVIGIVVLAIVAPNTTTTIERMLGVCFVLFLFSPIFLLKNKLKVVPYKPHVYLSTKYQYLFLIILQFVFVNYASLFYTGSGTLDVIALTVRGENTYGLYQQYFNESGIADFSISKIPAIISTFLFKFIFLFICFSRLKCSERFWELAAIALSMIIYSSFSLSRGTFFEVFEIVVALILRGVFFSNVKINLFTFKKLMITGGLITLFFVNTVRRFEDLGSYLASSCITDSFCFDPDFYDFSASYFIYILSTYFSMGIFFISKVILWVLNELVFVSLFPLFLYEFSFPFQDGMVEGMCSNLFICKGVWIPEVLIIIQLLGFPLMFVVIWCVLFNIEHIEKIMVFRLGTFGLIGLYYIYIFILSLPVGRFWSVSSSNIIGTLIVFFLFTIAWFFKAHVRRF